MQSNRPTRRPRSTRTPLALSLIGRLEAAHPEWDRWNRQRYRSILTSLARDFPDLTRDPSEIIKWLVTLPRALGDGHLTAATLRDYYKRIRLLYRFGRDQSIDLPELPYESFRGRRWTDRPEA